MLILDDKFYVEIELKIWNGCDYGQDISESILLQETAEMLTLSDGTYLYHVNSVDEIVNLAIDWTLNRYSFKDDPVDILDKRIWYTYKSMTPVKHLLCQEVRYV